MTQIRAASVLLSPEYASLAMGYRILNLDGTTYGAFTTTNVVEDADDVVCYRVVGGIAAPDEGGVIVWGTASNDVIRGGIPPAAATPASVFSIAADVTAILNDTGVAGVAISSATMQALADAILSRGVSNVEGSAALGSLAELLLGMFESEADNSTWVIYRTDHSTVFNTRAITTSGSALPVIEVD